MRVAWLVEDYFKLHGIVVVELRGFGWVMELNFRKKSTVSRSPFGSWRFRGVAIVFRFENATGAWGKKPMNWRFRTECDYSTFLEMDRMRVLDDISSDSVVLESGVGPLAPDVDTVVF